MDKAEKIFILSFLHHFVQNKLNQTRCSDPILWKKVFNYLETEIKYINTEVKK
tara:strand:- start:570 stop:728 length:159 start_codon:yes stop_codon:yes gene_type:complete